MTRIISLLILILSMSASATDVVISYTNKYTGSLGTNDIFRFAYGYSVNQDGTINVSGSPAVNRFPNPTGVLTNHMVQGVYAISNADIGLKPIWIVVPDSGSNAIWWGSPSIYSSNNLSISQISLNGLLNTFSSSNGSVAISSSVGLSGFNNIDLSANGGGTNTGQNVTHGVYTTSSTNAGTVTIDVNTGVTLPNNISGNAATATTANSATTARDLAGGTVTTGLGSLTLGDTDDRGFLYWVDPSGGQHTVIDTSLGTKAVINGSGGNGALTNLTSGMVPDAGAMVITNPATGVLEQSFNAGALTNLNAAQLTGLLPQAANSIASFTNLVLVTWCTGNPIQGYMTNGLLMYSGPTVSNLVQIPVTYSDPIYELYDVSHIHYGGKYYLAYLAQKSPGYLGIATSPDDYSWTFYGYMSFTNEVGIPFASSSATGPKWLVDSTNGLDLLISGGTNNSIANNYIMHVNPNNPTNYWTFQKLNLLLDTNQSIDTIGCGWWYFPERGAFPYYLLTAQGNEYNASNPFGTWNYQENINTNAGASTSSPIIVHQGTNYCLSWVFAANLVDVSYSPDLTNWSTYFAWSSGNGYTPGDLGNGIGDGTIIEDYRSVTQPSVKLDGTNTIGGFVGNFFGNMAGGTNYSATNLVSGTNYALKVGFGTVNATNFNGNGSGVTNLNIIGSGGTTTNANNIFFGNNIFWGTTTLNGLDVNSAYASNALNTLGGGWSPLGFTNNGSIVGGSFIGNGANVTGTVATNSTTSFLPILATATTTNYTVPMDDGFERITLTNQASIVWAVPVAGHTFCSLLISNSTATPTNVWLNFPGVAASAATTNVLNVPASPGVRMLYLFANTNYLDAP